MITRNYKSFCFWTGIVERVGSREDSIWARLSTVYFMLLSFELDELFKRLKTKTK